MAGKFYLGYPFNCTVNEEQARFAIAVGYEVPLKQMEEAAVVAVEVPTIPMNPPDFRPLLTESERIRLGTFFKLPEYVPAHEIEAELEAGSTEQATPQPTTPSHA